jgi:D-alanine-D-alanine ligase
MKVIALIFGGRSAEHEISILSAKNVAAALDKKLYSPIFVGISKEGTWYEFPSFNMMSELTSLSDQNIPSSAEPVCLVSQKTKPTLYSLKNQTTKSIDLAFPILHGTFGEDGCIQGLFKMMNLPFVGCGVLASAAGMDKEVMKRLLNQAGIPNAKYILLTKQNTPSFDEVSKNLGLPFFIKPANMGSSVGVHKIKSREDFDVKLKDAFQYDFKVLAEEMILGREIECSVMGLNNSPKASVAGEVIPSHDFYSYEAKYLDDKGAAIKIPADVKPETLQKIQEMALKTFKVMGCEGLTRVDFFLTKNGDALINEINTIPGFTNISMYPKMWEASGIPYSQLITQLIELGFQSHIQQSELRTNFR